MTVNEAIGEHPMRVVDEDAPVRVPGGLLSVGTEGRLVLRFDLARRRVGSVRQSLRALRGLDPELFLLPDEEEDLRSRISLVYPSEPLGTAPLWRTARAWRVDLPPRLPLVLDLLRFLTRSVFPALEDVEAVGPISPLHLRYSPGHAARWKLALTPAFDTTVADWVRADPPSWQWVSPAAVLGQRRWSRSYALGAVMHTVLQGGLWPDGLPAREQFQRLLRGRSGMRRRLLASARAALPRRLGEVAGSWEHLIADLLDAGGGATLTWPRAEQRVEELLSTLTIRRLCEAWQAEERQDIVVEMLDTFADASEGRIPWEETVEIRDKVGDLSGAMEAVRRSLEEGRQPVNLVHLMLLRRCATQGAQTRPWIEQLVEVMDRLPHGDIDEAFRVWISHVEAFHLGYPERALRRLGDPFHSDWDRLLALVLRARLAHDVGHSVKVSRLCKEGLALLDTLPGRGRPEPGQETEDSAAYVSCYLRLLDGVAHMGAVQRLGRPDFLGEAVQRLTRALADAQEVGAEDVERAAIGILAHLARFSALFADECFGRAAVGIRAVLHSLDVDREVLDSPGGTAVPWYDEERLFPAREGGG